MSWAFADCLTPLARTLDTASPTTTRLVLTGPYPDAAAFRAYLSAMPDGWTVRVHKAQAKGRCEARCTHASGRELRVTSAAAWFGAAALRPAEAQGLLRSLASRLNHEFRRSGVLPLVSPAVTGLTLWREEAERVYPPLPEVDQALIRATSGQGREELLWGRLPVWMPAPVLPPLPAFHYWDMKLAYPAVCENLPVGPIRRETGANLPIPYHGRVHLLVRIPREWEQIGILPQKLSGVYRPRFPSEPGEEFLTWCDAREARLALQWGWELNCIESLTMTEGRPLNTWSRRLLRVWREYDDAGNERLARAVRAILLQSIGDLQGRGRALEKVLRSASGVETVKRLEGERWTKRKTERLSHPEWAAAIWARVRYRLAKAMLALPVEQLVGCYVDCVYTAAAPRWPAEEKLGHLRPKGQLQGPLPAPTRLADLHALAHRAEEASHALAGG